jgi:hypothetical protein
MQLKPTFPNERFFPLSGKSGAAEANERGRFKAEHYSCSPHIWDHRCALGVQAGRSVDHTAKEERATTNNPLFEVNPPQHLCENKDCRRRCCCCWQCAHPGAGLFN